MLSATEELICRQAGVVRADFREGAPRVLQVDTGPK
jgi:hypothetical protein